MIELGVSIAILIMIMAKIAVFVKCRRNRSRKYYCGNEKCHLRLFCSRYNDPDGYIMQLVYDQHRDAKEDRM